MSQKFLHVVSWSSRSPFVKRHPLPRCTPTPGISREQGSASGYGRQYVAVDNSAASGVSRHTGASGVPVSPWEWIAGCEKWIHERVLKFDETRLRKSCFRRALDIFSLSALAQNIKITFLTSLLLNIIPELPAAAVRPGGKKDTKTGKEDIKLLSLAEKVMFYVENAKESETKLLAVISVFSKGCRMLDQYKHRSRFSLLMQSMWKPKLQNNAIYKLLLRATLNKTHEGSLCWNYKMLMETGAGNPCAHRLC